MQITVRPIEEADLEPLLEAERAANRVQSDDADFGHVEWMNSWTMSADDVLKIVRQRESDDLATYDSRTFVLEANLEATDPDGSLRVVPWLCGGFSYEIQRNSYEFLFLTVHPQAPLREAVQAALDFVKSKIAKSGKRKLARLFLRDRDEAGVRQLLPLVKAAGFSVRLAPDHFAGHDGWECVFDADEKVSRKAHT